MTKRRITVRGIILKDGLMLAQQLTPDHNGVVRDFWCTPGGGLDENEAILDGLKREMIEETGIEPVIGKLLFIQQFFDGESEQIEFFFNIKNVDDYTNIDLSRTTHGIAEVKNVGFIDTKKSMVLPAFLRDIDIQSYIDGDKEVLIVNNLK